MTNRTLFLVLASLLTACSPAELPPEPDQIFDFSESDLVEIPAPPKPSGFLGKRPIRAAMQGVQSRLVGCARLEAHPAGTIGVTLRVVDAVVEEADVEAFGSDAIASCMHDVLMTLELAPMAEPGVWSVHYPFLVGPN